MSYDGLGLQDWLHSLRPANDILFYSLTSKHFLMKFLMSADRLRLSLNLTGTRVILSMSSFSVQHSHGVSPCSSSYTMMPIDQISFFIE